MDRRAYAKYYHIDKSITTVDQLLSSDLFFNNSITKKQFLSFKGIDEEGKEAESNLELIWKRYTLEEQEQYKQEYAVSDLSLLKQNTPLLLPLTSYNRELLPIRGKNFLEQKDDLKPFFSEKMIELMEDPTYVKYQQLTSGRGKIDVQSILENCQVWIYSKTLKKIIDISPFVFTLNTVKGDIGSFSILTTPFNAVIDRLSETEYYNFVQIFGKDIRFINEFNIYQNDKLNLGFFERYIQQNDVVFIRFEKLEMENDKVIRNGFEIDKNCLKDQIFDMIALVDEVGSSVNTQNTDYAISINGRDLTKVLLEDGQYFMDWIYAQGEENKYFFGGNPSDKFYRRNYVNEGSFDFLFGKSDRKSIYDSLAFVINQMSNIGWTDNDLFDGYGDERTSTYRLSNVPDFKEYLENTEVNGVWQIIKLNVDKQISERRILNDTMFDVDGTLMEFFKHICQEPFVEFWGDTIGSKFEFMVRQPPFDFPAVRDVLGGEHYIEVENRDVQQVNLFWDTEYYSWYQFKPSGLDYDNNNTFWGLHFPIIYLEKYVENFGNHRKVVEDKYVPESSFIGKNSTQDSNITARALFNDLKFVLESDAVLPFTRKGTIVLNGDRRIKKGTFILLKATNELFYVDAVTNSVTFNSSSIDRTTVLTVKRGMVADYISGSDPNTIRERGQKRKMIESGVIFNRNVEIKYELDDFDKVESQVFSYYNIVKSDVISEDLYLKQVSDREPSNTSSVQSNTTLDSTVNEAVFEFFLRRNQMD